MRARRAFTLIELLIAVAIAALLAAIAIPVYTTVQAQAQLNAQRGQSQALAQAVSAFYAVNGCYPDPSATTPSMPVNLAPYVGGPWPSTQYYVTADSNGAWVTTPGSIVYYVAVEYDGASIPSPNAVYAVDNQPVPLC
jgi:prepilin-type N-terminal cleavage/methylation domain-containing protein